MAESITGTIVNYRVGPKSQNSKECIIKFNHVSSTSNAGRLIGRKVSLKHGKNQIVGKILAAHGKKGLLRVRFRKGVPGQAFGKSVELIG
ncbi:MAG: 50S ribosomal protein L35ae [Candidatus Bathyarchaeota archaeon]|jgi:large subunit ribosomal protein L35Ae